MYLTHTLLAQVAADRTADAERRASAGRQRRVLGSLRRRSVPTSTTVEVLRARSSVRPTATPLTRPRTETA